MTTLVDRLRYEPISLGLQDEAADYIETLEAERDAAQAELAALRDQIKRAEEQGPVVWMQSDHLGKFVRHAYGTQSMLVRCSDHKLHPGYVPLYAHPVPRSDDVAKDAERYRKIIAGSEYEFPVFSLCDDPENDARHVYGRRHIDELVDMCDLIEPIKREKT